MQQEIRTFGEWGNKQTGSVSWIGSYRDGTIRDDVELGKTYVWICETQFLPDAIIEAVHGSILKLQETFMGLEVLYYSVDQGRIELQFRYPDNATNRLMVRPFAISLIAIIAIVAAVIIIFIVLDKLGIVKTGFGVLFDIVPGMTIMTVGAVLVSVLPGKTKIAALIPIGVGGLMTYAAFQEPPPPPGNGNGNGGPPQLLLPVDLQYFWRDEPITFTWTEVSGATSYDLWFNGSNFPEETIDTGGLPYWTLVSDAAGVHKWKVRAKFGSDVGGWSEVRSFIIV